MQAAIYVCIRETEFQGQSGPLVLRLWDRETQWDRLVRLCTANQRQHQGTSQALSNALGLKPPVCRRGW